MSGLKNLATLTKEILHDFIVSTVIPRLASLWHQKDDKAMASAASTTTTFSSVYARGAFALINAVYVLN